MRIMYGWIAGLGLILGAGAAGDEPARVPGEEIAGLSFLTPGRVRFDDPDDPALPGRVSVQEVEIMAPLAEVPLGAASLAAGAWAGWTRLDFSGHPELESEDLYGLALILAASHPSETGWGWSALVMPGYYADLRDGRTGEGKLVVHAAAEYPFSPRLRLNLGAAYDTAFGDPQVYPVGGISWKARDDLTVHLVLPSPAVYWSPTRNLGFFAMAQPAGNRWIVDDDESGEQVFLIESWRAGLGAEHRLIGNLWLRLAGGLEFDRRYEARSNGRTLLDDDVDNTWYASAALIVY
jgi:hypothetical protein